MKTKAKKIQKPVSIEEKFQSIAETYNTMDPEQIKQRVMWRYISLLAEVLLTPGNRTGLPYHHGHFETCNKYIEHQRAKTIVNGTQGKDHN